MQYSSTPGVPKVVVWAPTEKRRRSYFTSNSIVSQEFPSQDTETQDTDRDAVSTEVADASTYRTLLLICAGRRRRSAACAFALRGGRCNRNGDMWEIQDKKMKVR